MDFKLKLSELLADYIDLEQNELYKIIEVPTDSKMGDFAFPCFRLAKTMKLPPQSISGELKEKIDVPDYLSEIKATGPYLNFFLNKSFFAGQVLKKIFEAGGNYGASELGRGKTVVFDYSSPNIAKQLHIGHLYTTVIGNALYKIYRFLGYNAVGINYLGDWGTQFGKMIVAYKLWGNEDEVKKHGVNELNRIYVKFHDEAEKDPDLENQARAYLVKMQNGDDEALGLWNWFRQISLAEMDKTYKRLNISFDSYRGESYYNDKMDAVVDELKDKNLLLESDGAMIVDLEPYKMPPCLILRADGGTLYPTRDIASAFDRKMLYGFYKSVYITDLRQSMHFAQFFKVIELMGYEWAKDMIHIPYGLLSLEGGSLSSRKGNVVLLEELFDEARDRVLKIIDEKNPGLENKDKVAEQVGIGAVIFSTLYNSRIKDVMFSWERILNFEGETGPYVQYTHARCASVTEKAGELDFSDPDFELLSDTASFEVIKLLYDFPSKIIEAADKFEPFIISRTLVDIAAMFNKFYHDNNVLNSEDDLKKARLYLVKCVKDVLRAGLNLLGIFAPEKM